jgi:hypothetical protein
MRALAEPLPAATELNLLEDGNLLVVAGRGLVPYPLLPGGGGFAGPRLGSARHDGPSRCAQLACPITSCPASLAGRGGLRHLRSGNQRIQSDWPFGQSPVGAVIGNQFSRRAA